MGIMARILFISHRIPYPANKGDKIRALQIIKNLKQLGDKVECAFPIERSEDLMHLNGLAKHCDRMIYPEKPLPFGVSKYFLALKTLLTNKPLTQTLGFCPHLYKLLEGDKTKYDGVFFFSSVSYFYKNAINAKKYICDFVDMDSYKWHEYADNSHFPFSTIYNREYRLLKQTEVKIAQNVDLSLFVTENEKQLFLNETPKVNFNKPIDVLGNAIDTEYFDPNLQYLYPFLPQHKKLFNFIMTGAMDYRPNYEGAIFFIEKVLPKLHQKYPNKIGFYCVGKDPIAKLKKYHNPDHNIVITGSVSDIRLFIAHAFASVAPLFIGRGIQNKVLEAMAMAKTCFVSPNAFEGISATDNQHLIKCDTASDWFKNICAFIDDPTKTDMIGQSAKDFVNIHYSMSSAKDQLQKLLNKVDL